MIAKIFAVLTSALSGAPILVLTASFIWGIFSVLLSPCHISGVVLIMGFIGGQKGLDTGKAFRSSLLFATGVFLSIVVIGLITGLAGRIIGDIGITGDIIFKVLFAVVFLVLGLYLMGAVNLPFMNLIREERFASRSGATAFIIGLLFGLGVGPCTFAYMAPVLGVVFQTAKVNFMYSLSLILLFGLGQCVILTLAGTSVKLVQRYLDWDKKTGLLKVLRIVLGVMFILIAAYFVYSILRVH